MNFGQSFDEAMEGQTTRHLSDIETGPQEIIPQVISEQ